MLAQAGKVILLNSPDIIMDVHAGYVERTFYRPVAFPKEQYMRTKQFMKIATLASAIGVTGTAFATGNSRLKATDAATSPLGEAPETAGVGGNNQTEGQNFDNWMNRYATAHNGQIAREEFMDQMGRRWDTLDAQRSGYMTPAQARRIYMPG